MPWLLEHIYYIISKSCVHTTLNCCEKLSNCWHACCSYKYRRINYLSSPWSWFWAWCWAWFWAWCWAWCWAWVWSYHISFRIIYNLFGLFFLGFLFNLDTVFWIFYYKWTVNLNKTCWCFIVILHSTAFNKRIWRTKNYCFSSNWTLWNTNCCI